MAELFETENQRFAQAIADKLIGTASMTSISAEIELLGAVETKDLCDTIDGLVFECDGCGWWCDAEELNNETDQQLCDECAEDEDD